jgi:hypothetical protein
MLKSESMKRFIVFFITAVLMVSCEYLDPRPIQDLTTDELLSNAEYGEGLLTGAYINLNTAYLDYTDYYTDNAVPSVPGGNRIALGTWTVQNNPIGEWDRWYETIGYLNMYLRDCKDLLFSVSDPTLNNILQKNRRGEAFFLRAYYQWMLLQTYGGYPNGGSTALGFPIVTRVLTTDDVLNLPRNTYEECVAQIAKDCDSAIVLLPKWYSGSSSWDNLSNRGRADAMSAWALKARVYLYAASPAYSESTPELWQRAAQVAHDAMVYYGGNNLHALNRAATDGTSLNNIFIQPSYTSNNWEYAFYPPSLYGRGECNPSQNLVDEFPAKDGYPISESPLFDPSNPYANRDSRLGMFIFYNGMNYNGTTIQTFVGGNDAPGGISLQGTRTGYYLKKNLNSNVRLTPGNVTSSERFKVFLSKTELYLNFIEAANEAYGPTDATLGFSANDVLKLFRDRALIDSDPVASGRQDKYRTDLAAAGKDAFRDLIRSTRRIELCFEGHRFWDIRRWNLPLDHTVKGVRISFSAEPPVVANQNIALTSVASTDYVSPWETLTAINDGFNPTSSTDNTNGKYGNWYSGDTWRYVQYDFPSYPTFTGSSKVYTVNQSDVYWFTDGGGLLLPSDTKIEYWNLTTGAWTEVPGWVGYGKAGDTWNVTTFQAVSTDKIRMSMYSLESTGIIEWRVWGVPANPISYDMEYLNVESHTFQEYMRYIPVPYNQTLVMSNLKQNSGW